MSIEQSLSCGVCHILKSDIKETGCCSQLICDSCSSTAKNALVCPKCKNLVDRNSLKANRALSGIIENVEVGCSLGCGKRFKVKDRVGHELECPNNLVVCPTGCGLKLSLRAVERHLDECTAAVVVCPTCSQPTQRGQLATHVRDCPAAKVACEFAEFGCTDQFARHQAERHLQDNQEKHVRLLAEVVKKQKKTIDELSQITSAVAGPIAHAHQFVHAHWPRAKEHACEAAKNVKSHVANICQQFRLLHLIGFVVMFAHLMWLPFFVKALILGGAAYTWKQSRRHPDGPSHTSAVVAAAALLSMLSRCNFFCCAIFFGLLVGLVIRRKLMRGGCRGAHC